MPFLNSFFDLNENEIKKIILEEEKRYEDDLKNVASMILKKNAGVFLLAGGSSCGKTTTAEEIKEILIAEGKTVFTFSTDDFFFDEIHAPTNPDGTKNYDKFSHTDSDYICEALKKLVNEEKVLLPTFDYHTRKRSVKQYLVDPNEFDIVILEGIHALNDKIVNAIPKDYPSFSALLSFDRNIFINETEFLTPYEARFIRRLIRDFNHRDASAEETFGLWKNVISEEKINIDPFSRNAEYVISTAFDYEICVEKNEAMKLLKVPDNSRFFEKAQDLRRRLMLVPEISRDLVPENSVINEFIY